MWHFSDNPRECISEAEVFSGFVLNKRGTQTRQQRDASIRLKEETDRVMAWVTKMIRDRPARIADDDDDSSWADDVSRADDGHAAVRLSHACLVVGCIRDVDGQSDAYHGSGELQSFRVVAAACLLKELNAARDAGAVALAANKALLEAEDRLRHELILRKLEAMGF